MSNQAHKHVWGWPIALYLFLGGLGSGMTILFSCADLFFGAGQAFWLCPLVALVCLGIGSGLLIFELGRPFQFWRVFSRQTAVLTFGAWMVGILVVVDAAYFSCWLPFFPWAEAEVLRSIVAVVALLLGFGVLLYTGIELASMKARVFWNTPALPLVFALGGLLNGCAADYLIVQWLPHGVFAPLMPDAAAMLILAAAILPVVLTVLAAATLAALLLYVLMMYAAVNPGSKAVALRWLNGRFAPSFWGGLVLAGLVLPLFLLAIGGPEAMAAAAVLAIIGGGFMRFLVVYSDDRRMIDCEEDFWARLPKGDEPFLRKNWG